MMLFHLLDRHRGDEMDGSAFNVGDEGKAQCGGRWKEYYGLDTKLDRITTVEVLSEGKYQSDLAQVEARRDQFHGRNCLAQTRTTLGRGRRVLMTAGTLDVVQALFLLILSRDIIRLTPE
jgi:hypothetical protein